MTFAWYGHLKYKASPLWIVIAASWGLAFFEYCLQVPANRMGSAVYSAPQLKGLQEIITLVIFAGFSTWYLGEQIKWNHIAGFVLIVAAAILIFWELGSASDTVQRVLPTSRFSMCPLLSPQPDIKEITF